MISIYTLYVIHTICCTYLQFSLFVHTICPFQTITCYTIIWCYILLCVVSIYTLYLIHTSSAFSDYYMLYDYLMLYITLCCIYIHIICHTYKLGLFRLLHVIRLSYAMYYSVLYLYTHDMLYIRFTVHTSISAFSSRICCTSDCMRKNKWNEKQNQTQSSLSLSLSLSQTRWAAPPTVWAKKNKKNQKKIKHKTVSCAPCDTSRQKMHREHSPGEWENTRLWGVFSVHLLPRRHTLCKLNILYE